MKHPSKICLSKVDFAASLLPTYILNRVLFPRKYRYSHSFFVILVFLNEIDYIKSSCSTFAVAIPKEEPIIISMGVYVVLNN